MMVWDGTSLPGTVRWYGTKYGTTVSHTQIYKSFFLRLLCGATALSFACSSLVGGMLFGVSGLLLLLLVVVY